MELRDVALTLLAALVLISIGAEGYAQEDDITFKEYKSLSIELDQKVSGTGFFSAYKYAFMPDVLGPAGALFNGTEAKGKAHGSGIIDSESNLNAESYYLKEDYFDARYDSDCEPYYENEESSATIELRDDGKMVYSPISMAIDSRYYNLHPVIFNSLLSEDVWTKNRNNLNSMNYMIEGAHGLDRTLDIDSSETTMTTDVSLTDGKAHFGVIEFAELPREEEDDSEGEIINRPTGLAMKAWKRPLIEIDEDYIGTFHIITGMTHTEESDSCKKEEPWLPCCTGGWDTMKYTDKKGFGASTKGVFDCTCFKVPKKAQFS